MSLFIQNEENNKRQINAMKFDFHTLLYPFNIGDSMDFSTTAVQQCDTLFILFRFCYVFVFISFIVVVVALFIVFACVVFFSSPFFSLSLTHSLFLLFTALEYLRIRRINLLILPLSSVLYWVS